MTKIQKLKIYKNFKSSKANSSDKKKNNKISSSNINSMLKKVWKIKIINKSVKACTILKRQRLKR